MKEQYQVIKGKPHFGLWFGKYLVLNYDRSDEIESEKKLLNHTNGFPLLESRNVQWISQGLCNHDPLIQRETLGVKYILWGRAFRVMKLLKKGSYRIKKVWRNGQRKKRKIKYA